jgi:hypothetical protein
MTAETSVVCAGSSPHQIEEEKKVQQTVCKPH